MFIGYSKSSFLCVKIISESQVTQEIRQSVIRTVLCITALHNFRRFKLNINLEQYWGQKPPILRQKCCQTLLCTVRI